MSSLTRTHMRQAARDKGLMAPKRGTGRKGRPLHDRSFYKRRRLQTVLVVKDWQCACGKMVKAGEKVICFHGSRLCNFCGPGKFQEIAASKGWRMN